MHQQGLVNEDYLLANGGKGGIGGGLGGEGGEGGGLGTGGGEDGMHATPRSLLVLNAQASPGL